MNLPNVLTLSRLGLAVVLMMLLTISFPFSHILALLVFIIAAVTDYLDGHLARHGWGVTSFGRLMDPLTDKVLVCAAFVSFVELHLVPAWMVVLIVAREFLVTGLRLLAIHRGTVISAGRWGKHKTVWQIVAIVILLLGLAVRNDLLKSAPARVQDNFDFAFGYIAFAIGLAVAAITMASGVMYFHEHRDLLSRRS